MVQTANTVYRDFVTDGIPASGTWKPYKPDLREWGTFLESGVTGAAAGSAIFATKAAMDANLAYAANVMAWVLGDATAANNGVYQKQLGTGTGSWTRLGDLPYGFIAAANAGAGTANAIVATTSIPLPDADGGALIALPIVADNTAAPVTVSFNGGAALTIKTVSGNDVSVGGLTTGMIVAGYKSGTTFRLLSDQDVSALVADFETRYLGSRVDDAAATAAAGGSPETGALYWNSTSGQLRVYNGTGWEAFSSSTIGDGSITEPKIQPAFLDTISRARDADLVVQIPTDYATLQAAVDALGALQTRAGSRIFLEIETGHQLTAGLLVRDGDYSRFWITYEGDLGTPGDATVSLDAGFTGPSDSLFPSVGDGINDNLIMGYNADMPVLACKIDMGNAFGSGYYGVWHCTGFVQPNCGVINGGYHSLQGRNSVITAHDTDWHGSNESAVRAAFCALISVQQSDLSNSVQVGASAEGPSQGAVDCSRSSIVHAKLCDISGSGGAAINCRRNSTVNFEDANCSGAAFSCISFVQSSSGSGFSSNLSGATGAAAGSGAGRGVLCETGARINISGATVANNATLDISIANGGVVIADGVTTTNGVGAPAFVDTNAYAFNVYSHRGIITNGLNSPRFNWGEFSLTGATSGKDLNEFGVFVSSVTGTSTSNHFRFYNPNGEVGNITTAGTSTAYNVSSDEAWKDFIGAYDPEKAIEIIRADPVREFHWKPEKGGGYAVGWGAQTSYAVSHDLASPGGWFDADGNEVEEGTEGAEYVPWGVDQGKRTPYLWAAVTKLLDEVDAIRFEVDALKGAQSE